MVKPRGRVLVVDDDFAIREIVATRLRNLGYEVAIAGGGRMALSKLADEPCDVVVLDILMPDIDGHQVLDALQEIGDPPSVIFLTALGALDDRLRGLYEGAVDYIAKPFEPDELAARVEVAVRLRQGIAAARAESYADPLTGLDNRAGFERALSREIARSIRYGRPLALVMVDACDLKRLNDEHGHEAGDAVLRAVAHALRAACRGTDFPARIGGDEFALVLPETDKAGAAQLVERLRTRLAGERVKVDSTMHQPECSIGMAVFPVDAEGRDSLIRAASAHRTIL